MAEDRNLLNQIKDKGQRTIDGLKRQYGIGQTSNPWPSTFYSPISLNGLSLFPNHRTTGWVPPTTLSPLPEFTTDPFARPLDFTVNSPLNAVKDSDVATIKTFGLYKYKDWRGHLLDIDSLNKLETSDRFNKTSPIPRGKSELSEKPYSTRDIYSIFNDNTTDYFKHGLHVIDELTPIENPENGKSTLRLDTFKGTPFEQNDPVVFGFEIIIDDITSPLLNGSVLDFLRNFTNVSEISSKIPVYEDFKQQFIKFFKTKSTVSIDADQTTISKMRPASNPESPTRDNFFQDMHKRAYMNYYLKKIAGLDKLIEQNTPSAKKFLVDYNKEVISLSFSEDVTLSMGTLAHLYKLLYWSKPNGKGIVPENLLRFNCDIIVSEVRNFNRVVKALKDSESSDLSSLFSINNDIQIIKDNVSRYVYSLKECQFYFNTMPHGADVDMGVNALSAYPEGGYTIQFDYKYSSIKLERFVPKFDGSGMGEYVGYDGGAMWRIGTPGARESRQDPSIDTSRFFTKGENKFNQNGVNTPFVIKDISQTPDAFVGGTTEEVDSSTAFERFKKASKENAIKLGNRLANVAINSSTRELQFAINNRVALLNRTLNRILNSVNVTGIRPPNNVYQTNGVFGGMATARGRIFYDIRGDLLNFAGDSLGNVIGGSRNRGF
jgi:hypothetical protein